MWDKGHKGKDYEISTSCNLFRCGGMACHIHLQVSDIIRNTPHPLTLYTTQIWSMRVP